MNPILIPPIPNLDDFELGNMHLLLSHLTSDPRYLNFYRSRGEEFGDYLILDNSAHEFGRGSHPSHLIDQACELGVDEVVAPDSLFESERTSLLTYSALLDFGASEKFTQLSPRIMMVPQGSTTSEVIDCFHNLLRAYERARSEFPNLYKRCPVIGVSKDYELHPGGLFSLLRDAIYPFCERGEIEIHCLGWGRQIWDLNRLAQEFPKIRSVDSAKPFVFAKSGISLSYPSFENYPGRSILYFTEALTDHDKQLALTNIDVFQRSAAGSLY